MIIDAGLAEAPAPSGATATGTMRVRAVVGTFDDTPIPPGWTIAARVSTLAGKRVGTPLRATVAAATQPYVFTGFVADVTSQFPRIAPWSAEHPNRYRVRRRPDLTAGETSRAPRS